MIKRPYLLLLGLLLVMQLGCQRLNTLLSQPAYDPDETIFLDGSQPRTLDPAKTLSGPSDALGLIFSGLVTLDSSLHIQPELAAGWTVSADGLVYTFYLRPNAVFHDGRSVTAPDVIYSWERAARPETGSDTVLTYLGDIDGVAEVNAGEAQQIRGLKAVDEHTLEVRLREPVVYFLQKLAYPVAFVVDRENVSQPDWEHAPNGTGPFLLDTWRDDELLALRRNDAYYLEPAYVVNVVYDLGAGLSLSRYEQGQIDLVGVGGANLDRMQDPNNPLSHQLQTAVSLCTSAIGINTQQPPLDDVRVRQAFNYALDRERLITTFSGGDALLATGALPPGMPGYTNDPERGYTYDPARARQLLAEAGYSDMSQFPPLTYTTAGLGDVNGYVTAVITMWQENLGVTIMPQLIEPFQYYDKLYAGEAGHFFDAGWCADYPDPQNFLDVLYHSQSNQNLGHYSNPAVDALLEQARVEQDTTQRLAFYAEAERLIVADAAVVWTSHGVTAVLVNPELEGYVLTPLGVRQWHRVRVHRAH